MVKCLLDPSKHHFAAWVWLYDVDRHWLDPMAEVHPTLPSAVPLYYASLCGLRGLVEHLVAAHPEEINARGGFYDTPLHAASAKGHFEIVELLLDRNADPNLCDDDGTAPLHSASQYGHVGVVKILLDRGVDVNQNRKEDGWAPLHVASAYGRPEVARLLIQCGAIVDRRNDKQQTPLYLAAANGSLETAEFLLNSDASVNATGKDDWTPLHWAAYYGYRDAAELLLDQVPVSMHGTRLNKHHWPRRVIGGDLKFHNCFWIVARM
jgi:ankyrin repeat protein